MQHTNDQKASMLNQMLSILASNILNTEGVLTTLVFKNKVHEKLQNVLSNGEFTQKQASEFLKKFAEEKELIIKFNPSGYKEYSKTEEISTFNTVSNKPFQLSGLVCYNRNNPAQYVCGQVRKVIRKAVKKIAGIKYDEVNTCTASFYEKKYLLN